MRPGNLDAVGPVGGARWIDVQRRWPVWSAARERQTTITVLDRVMQSVVRCADALAEMLATVPLQPRLERPVLAACHEHRRHSRDLLALSTRAGIGLEAGVLARVARATNEIASLIDQIAALHVTHHAQAASHGSRILAQLSRDMSLLVGDAWTNARSGRSPELQLRALAAARRDATRLAAQSNAVAMQGGASTTQALVLGHITAKQMQAIALTNRAVLVVLAIPHAAVGDVITWLVTGGATVPSARFSQAGPRHMPTPRFRTKDGELLALFARAGRNLRVTSQLLERLLDDWPESEHLRQEILECEHVGDRITHDLILQLHTATPRALDREDVFGLAAALDDVVDFAEEVADYLGLFQIEAPMEAAQHLARVLRDACSSLADALDGLDDVQRLGPLLIEIHRLENDADRIVRAAIASLFVGGIDPMVIIRWKDLFERLEDAIDSCETAAHILEGIVLKSA